jgi:acyl-CoA synthetase (AMP-forming)/AMP-acid ligase II
VWKLGRRGQQGFIYLNRVMIPDLTTLQPLLSRFPNAVFVAPTREILRWLAIVLPNRGIAFQDISRLDEQYLIQFDMEKIEAIIEPEAVVSSRPTARRGNRTANIEKLVGELKEHYRAARDHYYHSDGKILARPTQGELASRIGARQSDVSRCLNDPDAVLLQMYEEDVFMCVLPMFHVFAFTTSILIPLFKGTSTVIVETFTPKGVISELLEKRVNIFLGVPAMYMVLIEAAKNNIKFPDLRIAVSGGSALPVEIYKQTKELVGLPIIEGYGLTEASPACTFNPTYGVHKAGSIGVYITDIIVRVGGENDEELPPGEVGELLIRGENVMKGYYKRPEETAETLRNGWLHTGDLAIKDKDGYFFIVDRIKDIVVVAGLNVYPREVEEILYQHSVVKDAAVIGEPDALRGETLVAYVVLKEDADEIKSSEISEWMKERLAAYKIPRRIYFKDELPRNSSGKILKRLLKERK